jgi:hypothetical protein
MPVAGLLRSSLSFQRIAFNGGARSLQPTKVDGVPEQPIGPAELAARLPTPEYACSSPDRKSTASCARTIVESGQPAIGNAMPPFAGNLPLKIRLCFSCL